MRVDVTVANPNPVALPLRAIDWELSVGGAGPMRGRVDASEAIPAKATAPVEVAIAVHPGNAAAMIARVASGNRAYRLRAVLHFETRAGDVAAPIDVTGELR